MSSVVIEEVHSDEDSDYSEAEVLDKPTETRADTASTKKAETEPSTASTEAPVSGEQGGDTSVEEGYVSIEAKDAESSKSVDEDALSATERKERGNEHYKAGRNEEALEEYMKGIAAVDEEDKKLRAILHANCAAVYATMRQYELVIPQCTSALELNPDYMKARKRRAQAYDATGTNNKKGLEDWKVIAEADPDDRIAAKRVTILTKLVQEEAEKEQAEMLGKLKEMGNSLLGKFGLSLDNFQTAQDPQTGGYSVQFKQGGAPPQE